MSHQNLLRGKIENQLQQTKPKMVCTIAKLYGSIKSKYSRPYYALYNTIPECMLQRACRTVCACVRICKAAVATSRICTAVSLVELCHADTARQPTVSQIAKKTQILDFKQIVKQTDVERLGAQSVTLLSTLRDPTQLRRRQCPTRKQYPFFIPLRCLKARVQRISYMFLGTQKRGVVVQLPIDVVLTALDPSKYLQRNTLST